MGFGDIIGVIPAIKKAMKAGNEIKNPASWKEAQLTANRLTAFATVLLIGLRLLGYDLHVSDQAIALIVTGLSGVLSGVNNIMTTITSKKVGS